MSDKKHLVELNETVAWLKRNPEEAAELILQQQKDIEFYKSALDMRELQLNKLLGGNT